MQLFPALPCVLRVVFCRVLQCVAVYCSVLLCVAVCCSVLQCVAVCCSVLQCVAVGTLDAAVKLAIVSMSNVHCSSIAVIIVEQMLAAL